MEKNRRHFLSWEQKFAILSELEKRQSQNLQETFDEIGEWAMKKFNLQKIPHRNTILKIRRDKGYIRKSVQERNLKKKGDYE